MPPGQCSTGQTFRVAIVVQGRHRVAAVPRTRPSLEGVMPRCNRALPSESPPGPRNG
jgi:hypothetical protein